MKKNYISPLDFTALVSFTLRSLKTCGHNKPDAILSFISLNLRSPKTKGDKLGRKEGPIMTKEEYSEVISLLKKGYSIRNVAKLCNVSNSTVQRLKKKNQL